MIPLVAVEAAHGAIIGGDDRSGPDYAFDVLSTDQVRMILNAAAPHMLRDAWRDGADAYFDQLSEVASDWVVIPNPYDDGVDIPSVHSGRSTQQTPGASRFNRKDKP